MSYWQKALSLLFFVGSASAAHATAQNRFDLICQIQETESFHPGNVTHFSRHLSVDLDAGQWCIWDQNCRRLWKVMRITEDFLVLDDADTSFMKLETTIDRKKLFWTSRAHIKQVIDSSGETHGPCELAPFTPFPTDTKRATD